MGKEAIAKLIGTLDGQLSSLPTVAKDMVHQYVVTNYVFSAIWAVLLIATVITVICVVRYVTRRRREAKYWCSDDDMGVRIFSVIGLFIGLVFLGISLYCLWDALNPIISIISSVG